MKQTPLYNEHAALGARFTEFGGWEMPVQYASIIEEHNAVRTRAGIFDTSHMGTVIISGEGALAFLNKMTVGDMGGIAPGKARYSLFLNEKGGIIDDLIVYRRENDFLLVINAGNAEKDLAWLAAHKPANVTIDNISSRICLFALQGPDAEKILQPLVSDDLKSMKYYTFMIPRFKTLSAPFAMLARTGYTGEDGFEIFVSNEAAAGLWKDLVAGGAKPCGLGARDTLRLEACMPLHGHEISDDISPLEAGLERSVFWEKDFIGKAALLEIKAKPRTAFLSAFVMDAGVPRAHCEILIGGKKAGELTSGTFSPTLRKGIALGYVDRPLDPGATVEIVIHGHPRPANVVPKPFYKRKK